MVMLALEHAAGMQECKDSGMYWDSLPPRGGGVGITGRWMFGEAV